MEMKYEMTKHSDFREAEPFCSHTGNFSLLAYAAKVSNVNYNNPASQTKYNL